MGLETATYLNGLTSSWPLAGDTKSQGDDHIRLIKATLQATFPNASRPFYFPTVEGTTATINLDATDFNNDITAQTALGDVSVVLPAGLTSNDAGWSVTITKGSYDANAAIVTAAAGSIVTSVGLLASARVGVPYSPVTFKWNGGVWMCYKNGPAIGSVESFDGGIIPFGYLECNGQVYSNLTFAELFAVLGSTTLADRRGRTDIGTGLGSGLTNRVSGTFYGQETVALTASEIPAITSAGNTAAVGVTVVGREWQAGSTSDSTGVNPPPGGGGSGLASSLSGGSIGKKLADGTVGAAAVSVTSNNTGSGAHTNMQPSIGSKRIIRAC